jgi:multiple sugar transport system permease protein
VTTATPALQAGPALPATPGRRRRRSKPAEHKDAWKLVLPALLPVLLFSVYPLVRGIYLGFTNAQPGRDFDTEFTGLENYRNIVHYDLFRESFWIGIRWTLSVTVLQFLAALSLALLLNLNLRMRWAARTLALVPWAMPPVIIAIMWRLMLHPTQGPINRLLDVFGFTGPNWLGDEQWALKAAIVVGVWAGMPQTTITLLAGLQSVDAALHEAAAIDGASTLRRFWHITLPALRPVIVAITTLDLISNFNSFGLVYVLTEGQRGTMLPSLFVYNEAFSYNHWGYAAAMGNVLVIVVGVFLIVYLRANRSALK